MLASIAISFVGCVAGLLLSYTLNVPSGAFIIFVLIAIYLLAKLGMVLKRTVKSEELRVKN